MTKINLLSQNIIDKIAAGEVVVNGASVLKELLENSVDAGARNISVRIDRGGKALIRVEDDGEGIRKSDIPLAFKRNATSKITDSIDAVETLGFRGEALASIAYVSKVQVITKTIHEECGSKTFLTAGEIANQSDSACNNGTVIEVADLFYNIPARRKHLENDSAETADIIDTATKIAVSHPEISFSMNCDGREIFSTNASSLPLANIAALFGRKISDSFISINIEDEPLFCRGYISSPNYINERHTLRITVVNGRCVDDELISSAVDSIYEEYYGKKGANYILYINIPPHMVDVNIHPAKKKIRFLNESLTTLLIKQGIRNFLTEKFVLKNEITGKPEKTTSYKNMIFEEIADYMPESLSYTENIFPKEQAAIEGKAYVMGEESTDVMTGSIILKQTCNSGATKTDINKEIFAILQNMKYIGNAFGIYLMYEAGDDIYTIDTHAAHERVLYDRYMTALKNKTLDIQTLMLPVIINFGAKQYKLLIDNASMFLQIGYEIEDFSDNTVAIRSVPYCLSGENTEKTIRRLAEELELTKNISSLEARSEKLIKTACHNAVRGKENINEAEAKALLADLYRSVMPFTCPHGRPVIGKINIKYFMKAFERI